jgi:hypothetical protein
MTTKIPAFVARDFSVFDKGPHALSVTTAGTTLASALAPDMINTVYGAGATAANAVPVATAPGFNEVVLDGPNGICVGATESAGLPGAMSAKTINVADCNSPTAAARNGVEDESFNPDGTVTLFGIVPNGNPTVDLSSATGTAQVPVVDNTYYAPNVTKYSGLAFHSAGGSLVDLKPK